MQPNLPDHCPSNVPDHRDNALLDWEQAAKITRTATPVGGNGAGGDGGAKATQTL